jgi:N-acetyl-gamma-glutamyl-phosphate reductase
MGVTAGILGASGYAGAELVRIVAAHPALELGPIAAAGNAGRLLGDLHPQLLSHADRALLDVSAPEIADCDLLFLALPHGTSAEVVAGLAGDPLIVDLGADFRLGSATDWERWYGGTHAGRWPYGLPELTGARAEISSARRVANPGCYATAISLAVAPLLAAGLVEPADLVVVAASGTSGAGRKAAQHLIGSEVMGDLTPYRVGGGHAHLAELRQSLGAVAGAAISMSLTPILAPMPRGILATCTARMQPEVDESDLRAAYQGYDDEPFVTLLPPGRWPHTSATLGSNSCQLQVAADVDAGRAVVVAAIDNLGKGAAGQAVQNANLMLGLPEPTGLTVNGISP